MSALLWWGLFSGYAAPPKPNIIIILADDLGWNDVGWHNPGIKTPNLDQLAREGVTLNSSYVTPICSPSRASLLTGYYPFKLGLQHGVIKKEKPHGLPLNVTLLPEKLRELGYTTHMAGKWHLGFCNWKYTPTFRGFDTFFGLYTGSADHYRHKAGGKAHGYDFRYNTKVHRPRRRTHSTTLYAKHAVDVILHHTRKKPFFLYLPFQAPHTPLQAPRKYEQVYKHIKNNNRRIFSAMVTAMDAAVGSIMKALLKRGFYDNTMIIFLSDNGATPYYGGNNWPLRGGKATLWEGGTRIPSLVWGSMLGKGGHVNNEMIHAVDWFPTILSLAGGKPDPRIDGVNQWETLRWGTKSKRNEFVYGINQVIGSAAIRVGKYKLIEGSPGHFKDWYPPALNTGRQNIKLHRNINRINDRNISSTLLYNLEVDPIESNNIAKDYPWITAELREKLAAYKAQAVPPFNPRKLKKAHPKFWGKTWSPGWC